MQYGYLDESGSPGKASHNNDYFAVSLIVFNTGKTRNNSIALINQLRQNLRLPSDYEFHCSSNSTRPQTEFFKLLSKMQFRFITIIIHKNEFRKTASYARISNLLMDEIEKRFPSIKMEMDSNPTLHAELRKRIHERKLKNIKIREQKSHNNPLIQVADYVVNISAKKVKKAPKTLPQYKMISQKALIFIEVTE